MDSDPGQLPNTTSGGSTVAATVFTLVGLDAGLGAVQAISQLTCNAALDVSVLAIPEKGPNLRARWQ